MASYNKISIIGYLGRDPEMRYLPDGTAVCNFSVATTEKRKDMTGEPRELTTWFRINIWGRQAELAEQWVKKGSRVYLEGRLTMQEYTDREGNPRTSLEVRATELQFLDGTNRNDKPAGQAQAANSSIEDDEIPF